MLVMGNRQGQYKVVTPYTIFKDKLAELQRKYGEALEAAPKKYPNKREYGDYITRLTKAYYERKEQYYREYCEDKEREYGAKRPQKSYVNRASWQKTYPPRKSFATTAR